MDAYVSEDARLTGQEMHSFTVGGESVSVVVGQFTMQIGGRRFSGRDAVLWVDQTRSGGRVLRTIQAYIEGDATVTEAGGTVTRDRTMLVTVYQVGAFRASVTKLFGESITDLPLYQRAEAARAQGIRAVVPPPEVSPDVPLVPPTKPAAAQMRPVIEEAAEPSPPVVVTYSAGEMEIRGIPRADGTSRQVTICRQNVWVFDGRSGAIPPVQIQADAAVLFSADPMAGDAEQVGQRVGQLYVTGAYLEGDVRLSCGDHWVRGRQLYFDFITRRAVILDAVYHTVSPTRDVPIYVRADQVRLLIEETDDGVVLQEARFRDARVSTSEFNTPTYHVGAAHAVLRDATLRDKAGVAVEEPRLDLKTRNSTLNIRGFPIAYLPWTRSNVQDNDLPIRRLQAGQHGRFGFGVESGWDLFRLLGLIEPDGYDARFDLDAYEKATRIGVDTDYVRDDYTGYLLAYGVRDNEGEDHFGRNRVNIAAPEYRGRALWRHKQFLSNGWQLQGEFSYLRDRNYLEVYERDEFWAGKDQDSLAYAKKQQDNWALTILTQGRINDFQTTTESFPDVGFYVIGHPLGDDALTLFSESHVGALRLLAGDEMDAPGPSETTVRGDSRLELQWPLHWGALNVMPYTFGRVTYWSDAVDGSSLTRAIGGGGVKTNMSFWRVYDNARSRLLDIHRIRHVITPEGAIFVSAGNVAADEVHPFSPDIEQHLEAFSGATVGIRQRWQTYRGREGERRSVELARAGIWASFFNDTKDPNQPADGRFYMDRPEYSISRNALNGDFLVNLSDSTAILGDMNYDLNDQEVGLANFGVAVQRDPRFRTYLGTRYMNDLDSWVWTAGVNYRLSRKYEISAFQQYDLEFDGGTNLQSRVTLIRKMPRWNIAVSFVADRTTDDMAFIVTLWPEGMPEFHIGGPRVGTWAANDMN